MNKEKLTCLSRLIFLMLSLTAIYLNGVITTHVFVIHDYPKWVVVISGICYLIACGWLGSVVGRFSREKK